MFPINRKTDLYFICIPGFARSALKPDRTDPFLFPNTNPNYNKAIHYGNYFYNYG